MNAPALRTELAACTVIARDALLAHPGKGGITLSRALAGFAILVTALAFAFSSGKAFTGIMAAAGLSCGLLVILWWVLLIASVARQNLGLGRLVPGIGRRSVRVLMAGWVAGVACMSLPFVVGGLPVLMVAGASALTLTVIAMSVVRPIIFALLLAIFYAPFVIGSADLVLAVRIALALWIAVVAVRALMGRHSGGFVPGAKLLKADQESSQALPTAYDSKLARDCDGGDAAALLLHCLGPAIRAMSSLRVAAPFALFAALLIAAPALSATYRATPAFHFAMPTIAMFLQWMLARSMCKSLRNTAAEQSLVMLGARRPDAVGALLSRALMLRYGLAWLASTVTVLGVSALVGGSAAELSWMLAACLVTLAAAALLLVRAPPAFPASVR